MLTNAEDQARKERRELIVALISIHPRANDREIARMVIDAGYRSCSHMTVRKIRKQMERNR